MFVGLILFVLGMLMCSRLLLTRVFSLHLLEFAADESAAAFLCGRVVN